MIPNTIVLISRGRHDEFPADDANILPGHILEVQSDGGVLRHAVSGGVAQMVIAKEDVFQGGITTTTYASGSTVMAQWLGKGDKALFRIASGQNITEGDYLMSNGDGTLTKSTTTSTPGGSKLYEITAPSTTITNTGTETTFSNGTYSVAANSLAVGDVLRIHAKAFCLAENSTNTHRVRAYIGATTLADSTALQLTANDVVVLDIVLTIRTIGASGTFIADGVATTEIAGTFTETPFTIASTVIDTTVAEAVTVKSLASATSAGNQIRLDEFEISLDRAGTGAALVKAAESVNNTGGTTPFIRGWVN